MLTARTGANNTPQVWRYNMCFFIGFLLTVLPTRAAEHKPLLPRPQEIRYGSGHLAMRLQVLFHSRSSMPTRSVHKQVEDLPWPTPPQATQQSQEALGVPAWRAQQAVTTFAGSDPAKDVEPPLMVTGGGGMEGLAASRPHSADAGRLRKARLVLKHHEVLPPPLVEFFLSAGGTAPHLRLAPAGTHSSPVSNDSPSDAAISALDGPSTPGRNAAAGEPPRWGRPRPREAVRAARDAAPDVGPTVAATGPSGRWGAPAAVSPTPHPSLPGSPSAPSASTSSGSNQRAGSGRWDDNRPTATPARRSSGRARLQESPRLKPAVSPGSRRNARWPAPS